MRDIKLQIACDETRLKKVRGNPTKNSAGSTVENTAEEDMLDRRKREREIRNSSPYDEELWPTRE